MKELISKEILISLALGGAPIAVTFGVGGDSQMLTRLATLKPSDEIFLCFSGFLLLHLLVWLLNKWWLKRSERAANILNYCHAITEQIGFGIHGMYRAITGAVPVSLFILVRHHGPTGATQVTLLSAILVSSSLFMCCLLSQLNEHTKRRRSFL